MVTTKMQPARNCKGRTSRDITSQQSEKCESGPGCNSHQEAWSPHLDLKNCHPTLPPRHSECCTFHFWTSRTTRQFVCPWWQRLTASSFGPLLTTSETHSNTVIRGSVAVLWSSRSLGELQCPVPVEGKKTMPWMMPAVRVCRLGVSCSAQNQCLKSQFILSIHLHSHWNMTWCLQNLDDWRNTWNNVIPIHAIF